MMPFAFERCEKFGRTSSAPPSRPAAVAELVTVVTKAQIDDT